jgi:dienelactone hydrolase
MTGLDFSAPPGASPEVLSISEGRGLSLEEWQISGAEGDEIRVDAYLSADRGPVIVAGHGKDNSRKAQYVKGAAMLWGPRGISVVAADAPRHGDRAGEVPEVASVDPDLLVQWVRDHRMLIDAVRARVGDRVPVGYVGFSMGAVFGVHLIATDDRISAAALVVGGSPRVSIPERFEMTDDLAVMVAETDPESAAGRICPRPVLMLNADEDEVFSRRSAFALYDALRPPKEVTFLPGRHSEWRSPAQWHRRLLDFFGPALAGP